MRTPAIDVQEGFAGGLNTVADPSQLATNEMRLAENGRLTVFGAFKKRGGTIRLHATAIGSGNPVRGGFAWKRSGLSPVELIMANGVLHTGLGGLVPTVFTAQVGVFSTTAYPSYAPFRDATQEVCYIADGGPLNKWDGTNVTVNLAGTPSVARIAVQNQRLFGISGVDQTLYYSALNNGDTLGTGAADTGSAVIRTFGNQELTALLALGESLVLFHREGVSRFTGYTSDDISLATGTRGISSDTGTVAPDSVVVVENTGYFLTDRGIYRITELGVVPVSVKIESVINSLDQTKFNRVKAVHHRAYREIWFYFPDVGCYVFNYRLNSWTGPMTGVFNSLTTTHSLWSTFDDINRPIVLMGGADGFVRRLDTPTNFGVPTRNKDDVLSDFSGGTNVTMSCQLRRMYCASPDEEKMFRRAEVMANTFNSPAFALSWASTAGSGTNTWDVTSQPARPVQLSGRGPFLDLSVTDSGNVFVADTDTLPEISRAAIYGVSYGPRYAIK